MLRILSPQATALLTLSAFVGIAQAALTSVTISGNAFYNGTDRFYIRGLDYQPGGASGASDPLADESICKRDIPYFQQLGINTIRVYTVDNSANHDACMNALADAGIYLVLDTDNSLYSINRNDPSVSYNSVYLQSVFATIDAFQSYANTLAFLSGNEVINDPTNTDCAPYVKAVGRDMKQYIGSRGYRAIPVGYSAADVSSNQQILADYLNCGTSDERVDFYSINDYSWCDPSSFTVSGWDTLVQNYTGYGIPLFMSEFGCVTNTRTFQEVGSLYSTDMSSVFSGGLVYEYSDEGNGFGIVSIDGSSVVTNPGFNYLKTAYSSATDPTGNGGATSTTASVACPSANTDWNVTNDDLPAIPSAAEHYMTAGAGTGPGLTGAGSQDAGNDTTGSSGTATPGSGSVTVTASHSGTAASASATKKGGAGRVDVEGVGMLAWGIVGLVALWAL